MLNEAAKCAHLNVSANFEIARVGQQAQALLDIAVTCAECGEPFVFTLSAPAARKLRLAIAPASVIEGQQSRATKLIIVPPLVGVNGGN